MKKENQDTKEVNQTTKKHTDTDKDSPAKKKAKTNRKPKKVSSDKEIAIRRTRVAELTQKGFSEGYIASALNTSVAQIKNDRAWHKNQLTQEIKEEGLQAYLKRTLPQLDQVIKEAWKLHRDSAEDKDKIQALRVIADTTNKVGKVFESIGIIQGEQNITLQQFNSQISVNPKKDHQEIDVFQSLMEIAENEESKKLAIEIAKS